METSEHIQARQVDIVDETGRPCIVLKTLDDGSPYFEISKVDNACRITMSVRDGASSIELSDRTGVVRLVFTVRDEEGELSLRDAQGQPGTVIKTLIDQNMELSVFSGGEPVITSKLSADGKRVFRMFDEKGCLVPPQT